MTPLKVKALLMQRAMSVKEIAKSFDIDMSLASELIQFWVRRGKCLSKRSCHDCNLCDATLSFQWIDHAENHC